MCKRLLRPSIHAVAFALALSGILTLSGGQMLRAEETAPAKAGGMRITFIPPPMVGTVSLGIYGKGGKLIRILRKEASMEKDFTVALNGLSLTWDGKDEAGATAPTGKYTVSGYCVGPFAVEGTAYHCNDWMEDEETPHVRKLLPSLRFSEDGASLHAVAELAGGALGAIEISAEDGAATVTAIEAPADETVRAEQRAWRAESEATEPTAGHRWSVHGGEIQEISFCNGKLWERKSTEEWTETKLEDAGTLLDATYGGESLWVIADAGDGPVVAEYSLAGELLRSLPREPESLPPVQIAASGRGLLFVLQEDKTGQSALLCKHDKEASPVEASPVEAGPVDGPTDAATPPTAAPVSVWRTLLSKTIWFSDTFPPVAAKLGRDKAIVPEEKVRVRLVPNPLYRNALREVEVRIASDDKGVSLLSTDGLPLAQLTEADNLLWAVMIRPGGGSKSLDLFQSDGAVVEEFRVQRLANMMAFDAGEYQWAGK